MYDLNQLTRLGIDRDDAAQLRRIAMTLHRWHELECGVGNDYASWSVARGHKINGAFEYNDNGRPWLEWHAHNANSATYTKIPDRERGAQKRLAEIMAKYPGLNAYVQTDPRGAPLYILPPDVAAENYNRGVAVHK